MAVGAAGCGEGLEPLAEETNALITTGRKIVAVANAGRHIVLAAKYPNADGNFRSLNEWEDKTTTGINGPVNGKAQAFHFAPGSDDFGYLINEESVFSVTLGAKGVAATSTLLLNTDIVRDRQLSVVTNVQFGAGVTNDAKPGYFAVLGTFHTVRAGNNPTGMSTYLFTTFDYGASWTHTFIQDFVNPASQVRG